MTGVGTLAGLLVAGLTGCSATHATSPQAQASSVTHTKGPGHTVTGSPTPSPSMGTACRPQALRLYRVTSAVGHQAGAVLVGMRLHNVSKAACNVAGFPDIAFFGPAKHSLPFTVHHGGTFYGDPLPATDISLPSGYSVSFSVEFHGRHGCRPLAYLALRHSPGLVAVAGDSRGALVCGSTVNVSATYLPVFRYP